MGTGDDNGCTNKNKDFIWNMLKNNLSLVYSKSGKFSSAVHVEYKVHSNRQRCVKKKNWAAWYIDFWVLELLALFFNFGLEDLLHFGFHFLHFRFVFFPFILHRCHRVSVRNVSTKFINGQRRVKNWILMKSMSSDKCLKAVIFDHNAFWIPFET